MTTASEAYAALRAVLVGGMTIPLRFQNEDTDTDGRAALPDTPAPFAYVEFNPLLGEIVSFGGGRGANRYRNPARLDIFVFVPRGEGVVAAMDYAEEAAALLRSYRDNDVSCFGASVIPGGSGSDIAPPGLASEVNAYYYAAAEVDLWFDQIG